MNYKSEKDFLIQSMLHVDRIITKTNNIDISQKSEFDFVTSLDLEIEKYLIRKIKINFPKDKILSEESNPNIISRGRTWVIDPIDGTCNMAHGLHLFGIQCCLCNEKNAELSSLYLPYKKSVLVAEKNNGATINGEKIVRMGINTIQNAIISFGDYSHKNKALAERQHVAIKKIYPKVAKIRMFGSSCLDFAYVSLGYTDAAVILTKNLWDIMPGMLFASECGLFPCDLSGKPYILGSDGVILTANPQLLPLIVDAFSK